MSPTSVPSPSPTGTVEAGTTQLGGLGLSTATGYTEVGDERGEGRRVAPENVQHVAYVGTDGQVIECFFFVRVDGDHTWHHSRPSAGRVAVRPGTSPTSWYTTQDSVQHVGYVGTDGLIHECFFRTG